MVKRQIAVKWRDIFLFLFFFFSFKFLRRVAAERGWGRTVLNKTYSPSGLYPGAYSSTSSASFSLSIPFSLSLCLSSLFCPQLDNHLFMKRAPRFIPTINVSQRASLGPLIHRSIASAEFAMEFFSSLAAVCIVQ